MAASRLLDIEGLHVDFPGRGGVLHAVEGLDLSLEEGEVLGIVGESGSGKSVAMMALMGLIAAPGQVRARRMAFQGQELQGLAPAQRRRLAGKDMAMIFQDPGTCLNPCFTIGWQLVEAIREHAGVDRAAARRQAIGLLEQVGIPAAASRMDDYPHQLSGGMNQRVMIAMAISCNPRLLIADEPTTALDVTVQAQILDLLQSLQRERGMALVLITHDMGVVGGMADRIAVMYAGQAMELRPAEALLETPAHPYTAALLGALPERGEARQPLATIPGVVPGAWDRPPGCLFAPRCTDATPRCVQQRPALAATSGVPVRCHYPRSEPGRDEAISFDRAAAGAGAAA